MLDFQKLWFMLVPAQRRRAMLLLGFMFVGMMLETLGVGAVLPALALMTENNPALSYPVLLPWLDLLDNPSHERLIVYAMLALVGVYFIKVLFLVFLTWLQAHFISWLNSDFSLRLFTGYLRQPYTFHLQRNSAELIRNVVSQVGQTTAALRSYTLIITESLVGLGILGLMLVVEPVSTLLVTSVLSLTSWGFYRFTRERIKRWGEEIQGHELGRLQYLREGLGAAKDVKLLGREKNFIDQYQVCNIGSEVIGRSRTTLDALPRFWLELLGVTGIATTVLLMIAQNKPMESLLPALGLFAAAAFRLMPSANRLLNAIQNVRFISAAFNNLYKEFCLLEEFKPLKEYSPLPLTKVLALEGIDFRYPFTEALALKEISLSIRHGESVGFIGSTGAGKSTLVDIILGLLSPVSGAVKVDGVDIQTSLRGWQDNIGYVPQSIFLTDDTIRRNIAFGLSADEIDEVAVWSSLRNAQLEQFVNDLPEGLDTLIGECGVRLSGGQRQRIGIARALYHDPSVLVLDEATSSLDTATENAFMESASTLKGDKTLIIIAHRLSTVEHCDYLYRIKGGRMMEEGKPALLLSKKPQTPIK
jgi:ATP-binding cassette, subfamily B, bacterial PglK